MNLNDLRDAVYRDAAAHGLYENVKDVPELEQSAPGLVCRVSAEVEEAFVEAIGWKNRLPGALERLAYELADIIIMVLSLCGHLGIDIDAAVREKMEINKGRAWKHGKE